MQPPLRSILWLSLLMLLMCVSRSVVAEPPQREMVKPDKVSTEGQYKVRTFTLHPGELLETERGGTLELIELRAKEAVMKRKFQGVWVMGGEYNFGNHELLEITAIDLDKQAATIQLRTKTKFYVWDAFSF